MNASKHLVLTQDYTENMKNGFMICGINYGYSKQDKLNDQNNQTNTVEVKSFFSDLSVNRTDFRNRLLKWFDNWNFDLNMTRGEETSYEKSFFQTNWLGSQTSSISSHEKINVDLLVNQSENILNLIAQRQPSVIIFVGSSLIQAFNDIRIREKVESILGKRSGNAKAYIAQIENYHGKNFKIFIQSFGETQIICLPHTNTRGLSDEYMAKVKLPIYAIHKLIDKKLGL